MVADENVNGPADLPVIEFADFDGQHVPQAGPRPRKAKKSMKNPRPIVEAPTSASPHLPLREDAGNEVAEEIDLIASSSRRSTSPPSHRRPAGQTARQAYQQRLESDPSYVPTVGGFWGHDDRLLDKDLRSLSGWWRGRWQGRGRGRGYIRGRGRGGFFPPTSPSTPHADAQNGDVIIAEPVELPPIERAWTHDGFEEMKRKEEQRRLTQQSPQSQNPQSTRGTGSFRGSRGYAPGRGGRGGFSRGGYMGSPTSSRNGPSFGNQKRTWFAMKPELMWTKQHEAFLHFDSAMKPRPGYGPSFRVKIPGSQEQIIRAPPKQYYSKISAAKHSTASVLGSDHEDDRTYAVCLPKRSGKAKQTISEPAQEEEIFTVRPQVAERNSVPLLAPSHEPISQPNLPIATSSQSQPDASTRHQLEQLSLEPQVSDPARWAQTEEAVLKNPLAEVTASEGTHRPELPNLQTVFTPPPISQSSPAYGSPYGYAPALPPGIAMNQHGMAYELATGRPVYLQPPPPPMYNPRPMMHSHMPPPGLPFVPGHIHHHSAISPDFLAPSASHTPPMNGFIDPSTGTPIFSFPRQTTRIEIRAPSEDSEVKSPSKPAARRASGLRTAAVAFEPSRAPENHVNGYYPSIAVSTDMNSLPPYGSADGVEGSTSGDDGHGNTQHMTDPAMMAYPHYQQQQYYYPEAYAYPPYMDMAQAQYEMYPPDPHVPQGTVYY
ncbi:hypothetical protein BDZ94DRAFT_1255351 [Collybia nuda]|uniref:Btz domain-containing protein n=1 Tax=Collybia nuda TaxID=64659 RepID=A0A9P5Y9X4_9AGAR|nr:hypothetical protein BDZ94DRAFT_1255351 [Collybia nuda]